MNTAEQDAAAVAFVVDAANTVADDVVDKFRAEVPRWRRWAYNWERHHLVARITVVAMIDEMRKVDSVVAYRMVEHIVTRSRRGTD